PAEVVPVDVVLVEQVARQEAGLATQLDEYRTRFPQLTHVLDRFAPQTTPQLPTGEPGPGTRIDEFSILRQLGQGAFATVYLARQETMQRLVALKLAERAGDEPRALARLDHPNIVRVYDQRQRRDCSTHLIYMEYIPGGTLADAIKQLEQTRRTENTSSESTDLASSSFTESMTLASTGTALLSQVDVRLVEAGQVPPEHSESRQWLSSADWASTVAWIGSQLALALDYAHRRSVCHRDVKPANILMTAEGVPKLADFNVSVASGESNATADENFGGSLGYMSPEQLQVADPQFAMQADQLDGRSDLYSLAIVLWELWRGGRPWMNDGQPTSIADAVEQQLALRRQPLPTITAETATGRALHEVLTQTLQFDRHRRPTTGAELAARLQLALHPDAAPLFHPQPGGIREKLLKLPVWLVTGIIILLPNIAAGRFNFVYNRDHIIERFREIDIESTFMPLVTTVNAIAYPLGPLLLIWFTRPIAAGLKSARQGKRPEEPALKATWNLGMWAAVIGGSLWTIAGVVYPLVLKLMHPEFTWNAAFHFFLSLVLCGGVAWTFPFFGGAAAGVLLYYPAMIAPTMRDEKFELRIQALRKTGARYLIAAAMVPLLAAALISETEARWVLLMTLGATAAGVVCSFAAYQKFEDAFGRLARAVRK
ncbi:MAG: serine/threonine protein kinase, partial [Planctomycetales bacterium]|nr:serine/threonine protein kinase [Planctomycetales bacterium]